MEGKKHLEVRQARLVLLLIFSAGIAGHSIDMSRALMLRLTPEILFITGLLVLYPFLRSRNGRFLAWCSTTFAITYTVEYIGITRALPFGSYTYGDVLGFKLLGVPLIIGMNWVLVILGAVLIAQHLSENPFIAAAVAGLLAVLFDLVLEPVAISLNYWRWERGAPPLENYCAWYVLAFVMALIYRIFNVASSSNLPQYYFVIQLLFFLMMNLVLVRQ